jgi:hypothetical protein
MAHGYIEPGKHIYVPEDPDPLRDGLYAGYHAHKKALAERAQQQPPAPPKEPT